MMARILSVATAVTFSLFVHPSVSVGEPLNSPAVRSCDALAADPFDPERSKITAAPRYFQIQYHIAFKPCSTAAEQYPWSDRIRYQLARVLTSNKDTFIEGWRIIKELITNKYTAAMLFAALEINEKIIEFGIEINSSDMINLASELGNPTARRINLTKNVDPAALEPKIFREFLKSMIEFADQGDEIAQIFVANAISNQYPDKSTYYYKKAAENGNAIAAYFYAEIILNEAGSLNEARRQLFRLFDRGNIFIAMIIAENYRNNIGFFSKDLEQANRWKKIFQIISNEKWHLFVNESSSFWMD